MYNQNQLQPGNWFHCLSLIDQMSWTIFPKPKIRKCKSNCSLPTFANQLQMLGIQQCTWKILKWGTLCNICQTTSCTYPNNHHCLLHPPTTQVLTKETAPTSLNTAPLLIHVFLKTPSPASQYYDRHWWDFGCQSWRCMTCTWTDQAWYKVQGVMQCNLFKLMRTAPQWFGTYMLYMMLGICYI